MTSLQLLATPLAGEGADLPDFSRVMRIYAQVKPHLAQWLDGNRATELGQRLQAKADNMQPRIMVYGVYNAGKSTLINALMGRADAAMADRPETFKVTPYPWLGYTLLDTPGIDAPVGHEQVSRAELAHCDVILFVVASGGVADEAHTWREVIDILQRGRRVMLIINNKTGLEPCSENYFLVDDKLRSDLSRAATAAGLEDVLHKVSIQMVNAHLALKGRVEAKPLLMERSGIYSLESNLAQFLRSTDSYTVFNTCRSDLAQAIDAALINLQSRAGDARTMALTRFRQRVEQERARLECVMNERLDQLLTMVQRKIASAIHDIAHAPDQSAATAGMAQSTDLIASRVGEELNSTFQTEADKTRQSLRNMGSLLETEMATASVSLNLQGDVNPIRTEEGKHVEMIATSITKLPIDQLAEQGTLVALEFGKEHLPTFFKHVGKKTMERWAHSVGKWAGPVVHAVLFFWSIYRAKKQDEEQRQALVRQTRAIDDTVADFVGSLRHEYRRMIADLVAIIGTQDIVFGEIDR